MIDDSFAAKAGLAAPYAAHKDEPPGVQAEGLRGTNTIERGHCAQGKAAEQGDKTFATLRARLALAGYSLARSGGEDGQGHFCATRWGFVRQLDTLAAVEEFAAQIGARA